MPAPASPSHPRLRIMPATLHSPSSPPIANWTELPDARRRDLRYSIGDGACYGLMVGSGETYLQAFVLAVGLGEVFAGLIASVPLLLGGLLQLLSPAAIWLLGSHKRWVAICAAVQALCFAPLIIAAIAGVITPLAAMLLASIYWGTSQATGPAWNTWQGTLVPKTVRAGYYATRTRIQQATTLVGFLIGGLVLQFTRGTEQAVPAFVALFGLAFVCRGMSTWCLTRQSEPEPIPTNMRFLTLRQQAVRISTGPTGRLLTFLVSMQVGVYVAGPFFVPYMLKELDFSYMEYVTLIGSSFVAKFVCLPFWGRFAQRSSANNLLWIGAIGIMPLAFGWNLTENYFLLLLLQVFAGSAWGAYELAMVLLFFEAIPERERTSVLTLYNLCNAAAIVTGSLIGAGLLRWFGVTVEAYMAVFATSTLLRVATLPLLSRIPRTNVESAPLQLRPLSLRASSGSIDTPVLPALPDQTHDTIEFEPVAMDQPASLDTAVARRA